MPSVASSDSLPHAGMRLKRDAAGKATLHLEGDWLQGRSPSAREVYALIEKELRGDEEFGFDLSQLSDWDTSLPMVLVYLVREREERGLAVDEEGLPEGVQRLMRLSLEAPAEALPPARSKPGLVTRVGEQSLGVWDSLLGMLAFVGEVTSSMGRFFTGRSSFRWRDFFVLLEDTGMRALGIVGLISILTGLILAFVGAVQLRLFGAELYVADLVGLAMSREMAALMTGMIMAGRSGASFAATIGTMKVSEEIDALTTFGFNPVDMLVLPRLFAMVLMMPLLCIYSDLIGFLGGAIICASMLDISFQHYFVEMRSVVTLTDLSLGVGKSVVFGFLIAVSGCLQGMRCGGNAAAVGEATTKAVVHAIVFIVVADSAFAVLCEIFGI